VRERRMKVTNEYARQFRLKYDASYPVFEEHSLTYEQWLLTRIQERFYEVSHKAQKLTELQELGQLSYRFVKIFTLRNDNAEIIVNPRLLWLVKMIDLHSGIFIWNDFWGYIENDPARRKPPCSKKPLYDLASMLYQEELITRCYVPNNRKEQRPVHLYMANNAKLDLIEKKIEPYTSYYDGDLDRQKKQLELLGAIPEGKERAYKKKEPKKSNLYTFTCKNGGCGTERKTWTRHASTDAICKKCGSTRDWVLTYTEQKVMPVSK
jgi:hypothetical protein